MPVPEPWKVVEVWPTGKMPGAGAKEAQKDLPARGDNVRRITNISQPTLSIFPAVKPSEASSAAPAIIICPGGGYNHLCYDKEGTEVATWLNSAGITSLVLLYRAPNNREGALQDLQRALSLIRQHASEWKIDPQRVGVLGFSAGGHLAAKASSGFETRTYSAIDAVDQQSCRPDFSVLVYPAYLAGKGKDGTVTADLNLKAKLPPTLILHNEDDPGFIAGSKSYHAALVEAKLRVECKIYPSGGHGYGMRCTKEAQAWPQDLLAWLHTQQIHASTKKEAK
jgi:acetyl esterase/lipase